MIKHTVEISGLNTRCYSRHDQLMIERDGAVIGKVPIEDIGVLIIDSQSTTYSHVSVIGLLEAGAVIILCDRNHVPAAYVTHLVGNSLQTERLRIQIEATRPTLKRLWKQIVQTKIRHQAEITEEPAVRQKLLVLAAKVASGDPENIEAQAARAHWSVWLGDGHKFHRDRHGEPPNGLLNYGYMILRGAVIRSLVAAGLNPSLGLQHHNRYNSFCLADDLLESFRPLVDKTVRDMWRNGMSEVSKESKPLLLNLLTHACKTNGQIGPLMASLETMTASLVACLSGQSRNLTIPSIFPPMNDPDPCLAEIPDDG